MDRETRRIQNTKQSSLEFVGKPSLHNMLEGQFAVEKQSNSQLGIYRKKFGQLWKSLMSNNGDQVVERHLNVSGITKSKVTAKNLVFEKGSTLEIASGIITITHSLHEVEVEGASGDDNLDNFKSFAIEKARSGCKVSYWNNQEEEFNPYSFDSVTYEKVSVTPEENLYTNILSNYYMPKVVL